MAFGDYATLLDDFNRADANPLNGSWTNKVLSANGNLKIVGNQLTGSVVGVCSAWYTGFTPAADCEAYITFTTQVSGDVMGVYARLKDLGGTVADGYFLQLAPGSPDTTTLFRLDNGSATSLTSTTSVNWVNGDKGGIQCLGSEISAWRHDGVSWTQVLTANDQTYPAAGPFGVRGNDVSQRMDDFFGGSIVSPTPNVSVPTRLMGHGFW